MVYLRSPTPKFSPIIGDFGQNRGSSVTPSVRVGAPDSDRRSEAPDNRRRPAGFHPRLEPPQGQSAQGQSRHFYMRTLKKSASADIRQRFHATINNN